MRIRRPGFKLSCEARAVSSFVMPCLYSCLIVASGLLPQVVFAESQPKAEAAGKDSPAPKLDVGLGGYYKVGKWTPLRVRQTDGDQRLHAVEAIDPDGSPVRFFSAQTAVQSVLFQSGRLDAPITVFWSRSKSESGKSDNVSARSSEETRQDLRIGSGSGHDLQPALKMSVFLVASVGKPAGLTSKEDGTAGRNAESSENPKNASKAAARPADETDTPQQVIEFADFRWLPQQPLGLDALDALVIAGTYGVDESQSVVIRDWVRNGGHLVLSVGSQLEAYQGSPLAKWVPLRIAGISRLRELSGLETFTQQTSRVQFTGQVPSARLDVSAGEVPNGQVLVTGVDGPLVVRMAYGLGRITFVGLDLDRPPMSRWEGINKLMQRLLYRPAAISASGGATSSGSLSFSGITDLSTQLHAIQEEFPEVTRLSVWQVLGFVAIYILLIGPLDYVIVHMVLKKPSWTWVTFPLLTILAGFLAVSQARGLNGSTRQLNQFEIIDIDATADPSSSTVAAVTGAAEMDPAATSNNSGGAIQNGKSSLGMRIRGETWFTLYSDDSRLYSLESNLNGTDLLPFGTEKQPANGQAFAEDLPRLCWSGLAESTFGGMYRSSGFELARPAYSLGTRPNETSRLPISIWSTKGLNSRWEGRGAGLIESDLESSTTGHLSGRLTLHLKAPLRDWMIAYGNRVMVPTEDSSTRQPRALVPGTTWAFTATSSNMTQRQLSAFLTRTAGSGRATAAQISQETPQRTVDAYNAQGNDPLDWMRIVTFHRIAGGTNFTGIGNSVLARHDLSDMLQLNRAILIGRVEGGVSELMQKEGNEKSRIETSRRSTFVRFILPVRRRGSTSTQSLPKFDGIRLQNNNP